MSVWPSTRGGRVFKTLLNSGWFIKRQKGTSHKILAKTGKPDYVWAFGNSEEIGPRMLARIAKHTGLRPEDL